MKKTLVCLALVPLLSGCDKTKEVFGMNRDQPDEFTVLSRPPLSAPPGIGLKPPVPGEKAITEVSADDQAQQALGLENETDHQTSESEKDLLNQAGSDNADPQIKDVLASEAPSQEKSAVEKMLPFKRKNEGEVIDPTAEKKVKYDADEKDAEEEDA